MLGQQVRTRPVQYRQATAAQFAEEDPVLPVGTIAREKDTHRWKIGDGATAYNSLPHAVDVGAPVEKAAVSGAVSLNCAEASVFVLNLTGNITSFTLANLVLGKEIEVHFVQDGTGSRTLGGVHSSVKLAGGSLTLTTTASKRDVVRFRTVGNTSVETGRSLNL